MCDELYKSNDYNDESYSSTPDIHSFLTCYHALVNFNFEDFQEENSELLLLTGNATIFFKNLPKFSDYFSNYLAENGIQEQENLQSRILSIIDGNYSPFILELYLRITLIMIKTDCSLIFDSSLFFFISLIRMMDQYHQQTNILFRIIKIYCKHISKSPVFLDDDIPDHIYSCLEGSALISILKSISYQFNIFHTHNDQELLHRTVISIQMLESGLSDYQKFQFYNLLFHFSENKLIKVPFILSASFHNCFTSIITEKPEYMYRNIHLCLKLISSNCDQTRYQNTIINLIFSLKHLPANENEDEIHEISHTICMLIGDDYETYYEIFSKYPIMEYSSKKVLHHMIIHMKNILQSIHQSNLIVFFEPFFDLMVFMQTEFFDDEEEDIDCFPDFKEILLYFSENGFKDFATTKCEKEGINPSIQKILDLI